MEESGFEKYSKWFEVIERECNDTSFVENTTNEFQEWYKHYFLESHNLHIYKSNERMIVSKGVLPNFEKTKDTEDTKDTADVGYKSWLEKVYEHEPDPNIVYDPPIEEGELIQEKYGLYIGSDKKWNASKWFNGGEITYTAEPYTDDHLPGQIGTDYVYLPYSMNERSKEPQCNEKLTMLSTDMESALQQAIEESEDDQIIKAYKDALELHETIHQFVMEREKEEDSKLENFSVEELEEKLKQIMDSNRTKSKELGDLKKQFLIEKIKEAQQEGRDLDKKLRESKAKNKGE